MKTTKENNILLAEFLEWYQFGSIGLYDTTFHNDKGSLHWLAKDMKFHNDWNWLMEVVEKIEKDYNRTVQIERGVCYVHNGGIHHGKSSKTQTKIEAVYNACVEFVEWLNKEEYQKAVINSIDLE